MMNGIPVTIERAVELRKVSPRSEDHVRRLYGQRRRAADAASVRRVKLFRAAQSMGIHTRSTRTDTLVRG
jgi:hypothetical protein